MKLAALVAAAVLALAGCGGSSGGGKSTTTSTLSAAGYKAALARVVGQIQALTSTPPSVRSTPDQQAQYAQKVQDAVAQARDKLTTLHPTGTLAVANKDLVEAFGTYADLLGQLATAAKTQDKAAIANIDTQIKAETAKMKAALTQAEQGG